jgi:hypothetical protein
MLESVWGSLSGIGSSNRGRNAGELNILSPALSLNLRAEYGAILRQNFAAGCPKGLGGSNPPRSATESLSLGIFRSNRQIARASGLFCIYVVAEKIAFLRVTRNSRPKSLLANLARPFGPEAERSCDGRGDAKVSNMR